METLVNATRSKPEDIVQADFDENKQLEIMGALALMRFIRSLGSSFTEPHRGRAAAPLRAQPGKVTLYLALNRGYPEKADEDNAVEFCEFSARGNRQMPRIYTPDGAKKPIIIPVDAHFANLVVKWNAAGHNEGDVLLDFARRYDKNAVLMDGNAALHFVFGDNKVGEEDEMYVFRDVEDKDETRPLAFAAWPMYWSPARFSKLSLPAFSQLLSAWKKIFGCTSSDDDYGEWRIIRQTLSILVMGGFCIELLAEEVDSIKIGVDDREKLLKDLDFGGPLEQVWKAENAIIPHLHCELQLIHYLERNDIAVHKNVIGVTKLTCFACHAYLGAVNTRRKLAGLGPWMLPGASNKFHPAWLIPQSTEGIQAVNLIWERLKKGIQDLARRELRRKRVNGYGSNRNEHRPNNDIARYLSAIAITDTTTYK
ncbi:hypothetical protein BU15DRAFT_67922 [Melanogaster broomeanus]|nr:hypothetical protein BU15DRAFT_67922 [Melanogaster broomeanus]